MTILNVIEYKEEGLAIIEDNNGTYVVTQNDPDPVPLDAFRNRLFQNSERQRMLT
jgi:hypothetical protein